MFRGSDQIAPVTALLETRDVSLWHACQLRDFRSYLEVGGIPSRSLLEHARVDFTPFASDAADRSSGMWPKVFVNLGDFGTVFAHGGGAMPNAYGPIAMQIHPRALDRASDIAICLRSAGARDFDVVAESLSSVEDVDALFRFPMTAPFPERSFTLYGEQLRARFNPRYPEATTPEISMTVDPEMIPFEDVVVVWVDPLSVGDATLMGAVGEAATNADWSPRLRTRSLIDDRHLVLDDLVRYLLDIHGPPGLRSLAGRSDVNPVTREWAASLLAGDLDWQFKRYATYLTSGTLAELSGAGSDARLPRAAEQATRYSTDARRTSDLPSRTFSD